MSQSLSAGVSLALGQRGGGGNPSLALNFLTASGTLDSRITYNRNTHATQFGSDGNLRYSPSNSIRNNTMQGAVAGTPGTLPTNWATYIAATGITRSVVGTGEENGIQYVDIRLTGTPSAAGTYNIYFENTTATAALTGQMWTTSAYLKVSAGSLSNVSYTQFVMDERDSGGLFLGARISTSYQLNTSPLNTQRYSFPATMLQAGCAYVVPYVSVYLSGAGAVDITLRIGLPQLELGNQLSPVIRTTNAAIYGPRLDCTPGTGVPRGLLVENTATNGIRNNTMQGAVAGTPGTPPTNWLVFLNGITGVTLSIIGTGTQAGVTYIDIRMNGTPSATAAQGVQVAFDTNNSIAATASQVWSHSAWVSVVGGSTANITGFVLNTQQYNAGAFVQSNNTSFTPTATFARYTGTVTFSASTTTNALPCIGVGVTASAAIDITLRIGLPQCELGTYVSSVIPTFGTAVTRGRDEASIATSSSWYNQTAGTVIVEAVRDTIPAPATLGASYGRFFSVSDGTLNNAYACGTIASQANVYTAVTSGGVETMAFSSLPMTAGAITKCGLAISNASARMALNGTLSGAADSTCTMPTATTMTIGQRNDFSMETTWSGWIRNLKYWRRRVSNTELQKLTT